MAVGSPVTQLKEGANDSAKLHTKRGVVYDENGKICKSCTSFRDLIKVTKKKPLPDQISGAEILPAHCPPDVEVLGRATWTFLHTIAATYPQRPSVEQKSDMVSFLGTFSKFYPCWHCADEFRQWMSRGENRPNVETREGFENWMCRAHNEVNARLGKEAFDCSRESLNIRWRDGPKDGSCG